MRALSNLGPGGRRTFAHGVVPRGVIVVLLSAAAACLSSCGGGTHRSVDPSAAAAVETEAAATVPSGLVAHEGRWLTDAAGRVLLLHGVNMVAKEPPYEPGAAGFSDDDAAWLADNGLRVVRLGVLATGLMPAPGKVDEAYIAHIAETVDVLSRHGVYVLLDFHQDGWGPSIGSDGFPAWMTVTNGAEDTHASFPLYYIQNPAIQAAFQSFWDNAAAVDGTPLQTYYAQMFAAVASRFAGVSNVLGYDLFNEPWSGTTWLPCVSSEDGCANLDSGELGPAYARAVAVMRAAGDHHLIFGEPFVLFNFGLSTTHVPLPGEDAATGLSFHVYTLDKANEPKVLANAIGWSGTTGGALFNTEWGATTDADTITRLAREMDDALMPWIFWSYCCEVVHSLDAPPADANLVEAAVAALVRPYPLAVAGTPTRLAYDPATRTLRFSWSTSRAGGGRFPRGAVTGLAVPASVYPSGYGVTVTGGSVVSGCRGSEVAIAAAPDATTVTVTIAPNGSCG